MTCKRMRRLLPGYAAGLLTQAARDRVRAHLRECADCRGEVDEFRRLDRQLTGDRIEADDVFVGSVMAQVRATVPEAAPAWLTALEQTGPLVGLIIILALAASILLGLLAECGPVLTQAIDSSDLALLSASLPVLALALGLAAALLTWLITKLSEGLA